MRERRPILVLGGTGLLGEALVALLGERGHEVLAPPRQRLDLGDTARLAAALAELAPAVVFNAAAFTDVARAETAAVRDEVFRLNRDVPAELAAAAAAARLSLVHVSTDYVFDGRARHPYREDDSPQPLQVYGRSKLEGEQAVLERDPAALIVRTSTLYGPGRRARPHYVEAILGQAERGLPLRVVRLPESSPTYAPHLAAALVDLWQAGASGIVHAVNEGGCSRLELATETVRRAGHADVEVLEREPPPGDLARPAYSVLDTTRLAGWIGRRLPHWSEGLDAYLEVTGR